MVCISTSSLQFRHRAQRVNWEDGSTGAVVDWAGRSFTRLTPGSSMFPGSPGSELAPAGCWTVAEPGAEPEAGVKAGLEGGGRFALPFTSAANPLRKGLGDSSPILAPPCLGQAYADPTLL